MENFSKITSQFIVFEKPLNETMRLLLRLDGLFRHYATLRDHQNPIHLDDQLNILLRLILVTDRADLKSKMTQLIHLLVHRLQKWQQHKNANQETIQEALEKCKKLITYFDQTRDKLGQHLRDHYFIKQLLANMNHPGGLAEFVLPVYALWNKQIIEQRSHDVNDWMKEFIPLKQCVHLLLTFIRQNCECQTVWVDNGFYQQPIDSKKSVQLFQVELPSTLNIYPVISVGRHHVSVHFHHIPQAGFDMSTPQLEPFECKLCFCDL